MVVIKAPLSASRKFRGLNTNRKIWTPVNVGRKKFLGSWYNWPDGFIFMAILQYEPTLLSKVSNRFKSIFFYFARKNKIGKFAWGCLQTVKKWFQKTSPFSNIYSFTKDFSRPFSFSHLLEYEFSPTTLQCLCIEIMKKNKCEKSFAER